MLITESVSFPAKLDRLDEMIDWIDAQSLKMPLSSTQRHEIEIAMEEVLVNIILHAYKETEGSIALTCHIDKETYITFHVKDHGFPFNPLLQVHNLSDTPLEQRQEGGLGIFLMRTYMDEVHYERANNQNILTLTKSLH